MASSYPGGLDSFATNKADATATVTDHPAHHNDLADAINKIEAELGINPSGAAASVAAAIAAVSAPFADSVAAAAINSLTDVTAATTNVTGIAAGDLIIVDIWGFINNGTGGNRTVTLTLDFDAAFDMEWAFTSVSTVQYFRMTGEVAVVATNLATLNLTAFQVPQITVGTVTSVGGTGGIVGGYDTTTQDLTGTTAVTLFVRSDSASATQELTPLGFTIRKLAST